jgi:peptide/nickel transport system substrate-binding protein
LRKVLANQIEKTGLKVKLQSYESSTFFKDLNGGNFQLATVRWVGVQDPDIYRQAFHSKELPPGRNRGAYSNADLDKLLERGNSIANETERMELYLKVQTKVLSELPIIPLWYPTQTAVVNRRVSGYEPPVNGDFTAFISVTKDQ